MDGEFQHRPTYEYCQKGKLMECSLLTQCFNVDEHTFFKTATQFYPIYHLKPFSLIAQNAYNVFPLNTSLPGYLEIDRLFTESEFTDMQTILEKDIIGKFKALRIKDMGLANFLSREYPDQLFQFKIDTGFQNSAAIRTLTELFGNQLDCIIMPPIFAKSDIESFSKITAVPFEIELFGPVKLFFSHRMLLDTFKPDTWVEARSDEFNHHAPFKTYQNEFGTLLYYPKYISLIKKISELKKLNILRFRIDRLINQASLFFKKFKDMTLENMSDYEASLCSFFNATTIEGFYSANKTDTRFRQLKSPLRSTRDHTLLGQVIESRKSEYMVIRALNSFSDDLNVTFKTPLNDIIPFKLKDQMKSIHLKPITHVEENQLCVLPPIKKVTPKTHMYLEATKKTARNIPGCD